MTNSTAAGLPDEPVLVRTERDFLVDGWLVQPARNQLVNGTTVIRVRPQLIDILTCLATQPGRVVPKSLLLKRVWGDRFVADSGVTRCMAELRGILKDDARRPRIIETITKRGYRLIAPVSPPGSLQTGPHAVGRAFPLSLETWRRLAPADAAPAAARHEAAPALVASRCPASRFPWLVSAGRSLMAMGAALAIGLRDAARVVLR